MKNISTALVSLSFLFLLSINALANHKDLKEHITVTSKMYVNGTEVKPGRYTVRYMKDSGDMTLSMNGKVVAQTKATVTSSNDKFDKDALLTRDTGNGVELTGIRLGGQREEIHIGEVTAEVDAVGVTFPDAVFYITEDGFVSTDLERD